MEKCDGRDIWSISLIPIPIPYRPMDKARRRHLDTFANLSPMEMKLVDDLYCKAY
jgi:hypothetical protein